MAMHLPGCTSEGPWGGPLGTSWVYKPIGPIEKIHILYGVEISIDCPNEYLTSISGTIGSFGGYDVVTSLCFHTNRKRHGPYGPGIGGTRVFSYEDKGKVIVGFHGRAGIHINAIGIYIMTTKPLPPSASEETSRNEKPCLLPMPTTGKPRDAGPWGASGGEQWDDGFFSNLKRIRVYIGESVKVIYGIKFQYIQDNGQLIWSQVHGEEHGVKMKEVCLNGVDEYVTGISGLYGPFEAKGYVGLEGITSITFHTNKGIYGPFGKGRGDGYLSFASASSPGKVHGFHGRSAIFLYAIGVHMEYF